MKEMLKAISVKLIIWSFLFNLLYSIADYGQSFSLAIFATAPFNEEKAIKLIICVALTNFLQLIFSKFASYVDNKIDVTGQINIQKYYFKKIQSMTMQQISNTHTGYIYKLITNVSRYFVNMFWQFENSVIPLFIGSFSILYVVCKQSVIIGIVCILISSLAVFLKYKLIKKMRLHQMEYNEKESKYSATFVDFIQNIVAVRKLNIEKFCNKKINENAKPYIKALKNKEIKRLTANSIFTILMDLLYLVVISSTIFMIRKGEDGLAYLLFYITALGKLYYNLNSLVRFLDIFERYKTSKKQLDDFLKDNIEIKLINSFNNIKLREVVFSYTKNSVKIKIPEFILNKGEKISIVGESGQGKTTVMNILAGLYPLENGNLFINDKEEKNKRLDLVFVSQEVELFDLSIRDNLCLGKDIPDEKLIQLIEEAGLKNWYNELPSGLDTLVGEKGTKLSVGQKQRLNLIRGILIDKEIYFLDEPTSNLDIISEEKIINMIEKYLKDKTYVIITHREKLKKLCNRHYKFENHMMKEMIINI